MRNRKREELESVFVNSHTEKEILRLVLEVLLDIRELALEMQTTAVNILSLSEDTRSQLQTAQLEVLDRIERIISAATKRQAVSNPERPTRTKKATTAIGKQPLDTTESNQS